MDVTYYTHTIRTPQGRRFETRTVAPTTDYAGSAGYTVEQTERTVLHLELGDPVLVRAFGRERPGHVVKLGRTLVTVDFQQNSQGKRGTRSASAWELSPAGHDAGGQGGTRFDREVIT